MWPSSSVTEEAADARQFFEFATQAPKLPSSQAPKLFATRRLFRVSGTALAAGVSATPRRSSLPIAIFLGIASLLFSSGCGVSNATSSVGKTEVDAAALEIDAGVIFSDRSSYLCIPLSRFALSSSENIESTVSSYECVKPSLVRYSDSSTTTADGVLFEFIPDEASPDTAAEPMRLGVVTTLTLVGGATRTLTLSFLHAQRRVVAQSSLQNDMTAFPVSFSCFEQLSKKLNSLILATDFFLSNVTAAASV